MAIITLSDVRGEGYGNPPYSDARVTTAIAEVEQYITDLILNWFEIVTLTLTLDGTGEETLYLPHPIVSIDTVKIDGVLVAAADYKVFNRHLTQKLLKPDDRKNPRITFKHGTPSYGRRSAVRRWPEGVQNIEVVGDFAYRDYDGTATGQVPLMAKRVALILIDRFLEQEGDVYAHESRRAHDVKRVKTRNTEMEYGGPIASGKQIGSLTGDPAVDRILAKFMAPMGVYKV